VKKEEGAGAIGVLGQARAPASLAEESGLLIAGHTRHWHLQAQILSSTEAESARAAEDLRKNGPRNLEGVQQFRIPPSVIQIVEEGPGSVGVVGGVNGPSREAGNEPAVHRPGSQLPGFGPGSQVGTMSE
jgi:hypothetical protein